MNKKTVFRDHTHSCEKTSAFNYKFSEINSQLIFMCLYVNIISRQIANNNYTKRTALIVYSVKMLFSFLLFQLHD
jgi:hypothetical protein